ncbi:MAG: fructosamine kinase family protein [Caldilineaceae bacterium]
MPEIEDRSIHFHLTAKMRAVIEQRVSLHFGRPWQIAHIADKRDEASHPAAVLSDTRDAIFVKFGAAWDQLQIEAASLRLLTERAGVLTPTVIDIVRIDDAMLMIMEAVQTIARGDRQWREMGYALAQIHRTHGERYGLETNCYWGSLVQDNTPADNWPEFFWTRRVEPHLRGAVDEGRLPIEIATQIEQLGSRLTELCGPPVAPTLLHGDSHQNNFISSPHGAVLIDPAVYYGHPEMDLAYVDVFAPVSDELYAGYQEMMPVAPGFEQRRHLWVLPFRLAMIEVNGAQHVDELRETLRRIF